MNESTFDEHLNRLLRLAKGTSISDFLMRHENEIVNFLTSFRDRSSHDEYRSLTRKLYFDLWKRRLKPFGRREWLVGAKFDELTRVREWYNQFFDTVERIPALAEVVGEVWLIRIKANAKALQARIFQHQKRAYQAIDLFGQAAEDLEKLPNPNYRDLANASAHLARSVEMRAFQCLRKRPAPDLQGAFEEFEKAASYAKRGEVLLRKEVNNVTSQYLWFLRYWQHVAAIGLFPLRDNFAAALKHVSLASRYVSKLPSFPIQKWYVDVEDLLNQSIVIRAYEAFIAKDDMVQARSLLVEWLDKSKNIQATGRYLRVLLRKLSLDVLLEVKAESGRPHQLAIELERLVTSRRVFGRADMYLRETIRALVTTNIDYAIAVARIKEVFIVDSPPPPGFVYLDPRNEVEKSFLYLPSFFWSWLQDAGYEDEISDEELYIFLLYVRCVAEFWVCVYKKRRSDSEMDRLIDVELPSDFSLTNWKDLLITLNELANAFQEEPSLAELLESVKSFLDRMDKPEDAHQVSDEELRSHIVETICKTQRRLFPHPVFLSHCTPTERGRVFVELARIWSATPKQFDVTFRPRLDQQLHISNFYFLKPPYKRSGTAEDTEDLILYPLKPSSCFGIPCDKKVALLVEGVDEFTVFSQLLTNFNPHWRARIELVKAQSASKMLRTYEYLGRGSVYAHRVVVGDVVGSSTDLEDIRRKNPYVYTLDPDLEGVQPKALILALAQIASDLSFTVDEIIYIISQARKEKRATIACLKEYQKERDSSAHPIFNNTERLKRKLAEAQAHNMIEIGPCKQILAPLCMTLHLAFGHSVDDVIFISATAGFG